MNPMNIKAVNAFIARKAEIDDLLARLADASDDHFGADPDAIDWGHVGTLDSMAAALRDIVENNNV
jgi:hypothetical protein